MIFRVFKLLVFVLLVVAAFTNRDPVSAFIPFTDISLSLPFFVWCIGAMIFGMIWMATWMGISNISKSREHRNSKQKMDLMQKEIATLKSELEFVKENKEIEASALPAKLKQ